MYRHERKFLLQQAFLPGRGPRATPVSQLGHHGQRQEEGRDSGGVQLQQPAVGEGEEAGGEGEEGGAGPGDGQEEELGGDPGV